MRLDKAEYRDGVLHLTTRDPEAIRFAYQFTEGEYSLSKTKKKRSLDANAYAWVLIDKISAALRLRHSLPHKYFFPTNALSRVADIYVCDDCGSDEALRAFAGIPLPVDEWFMARIGGAE